MWVWWIFIAGILGASGLILNALLAHKFQTEFNPLQLDRMELGLKYQLLHITAFLALALVASHFSNRALNAAGGCFVLGLLCFSGGLYGLALTSFAWLSRIVPLGGGLLILGWILLSVSVVLR